MGTIFIDNQDKNLLKLSFDIVSSIYYNMDNPNIEIHSFINEYKENLKRFVYLNPSIPDIDQIKSNLVSNFIDDLEFCNIDLNNPNPLFLNKFINTLEIHKNNIGLMWFYDSLPMVSASFANLEIINDLINELKSLNLDYLDLIYKAIFTDLIVMLEENEFGFGETINAILSIKKNETRKCP